MSSVSITSFGFLHRPAPAAHLTVDLRQHFRDPHVAPGLRELTAADTAVRTAVLGTPGIPDLIAALEIAALAYLAGPAGGDVRIAIGCAGGRHRAPVTADELAARLRAAGAEVEVGHRDLHQPVIHR